MSLLFLPSRNALTLVDRASPRLAIPPRPSPSGVSNPAPARWSGILRHVGVPDSQHAIFLGCRLRYKGKTVRSRRLLGLRYIFVAGKAHPATTTLTFGCLARQIAKQRVLIGCTSARSLGATARRFHDVKPPNLYHGRGIRPNRLALFWKAGKVSAYR